MTIVSDELPLSQHDVLDWDDCALIRERVIALREHWTERSPGSFYTLGAASYLDGPNKHDAYLAAAHVTNQVLQEHFDAALATLREFFEELLDDAVLYDPRYALPGFHIFLLRGGDRSNDDVAQRAHFDLQWMHAMPGQEPQGTLSFTLPIEQPSGGACMAVWPPATKTPCAWVLPPATMPRGILGRG